MDEKLAKDILLICKHRYNTEKYATVLDAMNAYYHKHYGNEDISMDYQFAVILFIKPTLEYFLTPDRVYGFINNGLFAESVKEKRFLNPSGCTDFYETIYNRLTTWLCLLDVNRFDRETKECTAIIDLSGYPLDNLNWNGVI